MKLIAALIAGFILMAASAAAEEPCEIPDRLQELLNISIAQKPIEETEADAGMIKGMRPKAITDAAYTLALQNGVSWYYGQITACLANISAELDKTFDFRGLIYKEKILPAIILRADDSYFLQSQTSAIESDATYRIHQRAKIVTVSPNWRDYLWREFETVKKVNPHLHPQTPDEAQIWNTSIIHGWNDGVNHARWTFEENLNHLLRDYKGITRAHILSANRVIEMPMIATGTHATKLSENGTVLDINQRITRISSQTIFTPVKEWAPVIGN